MPDRILVRVHVKPRASRSGILGIRDGRIAIRTTAPPADGRANRDVMQQLAAAFGVPPSRVSLKAGAHSRLKTFVVEAPAEMPAWMADADFC